MIIVKYADDQVSSFELMVLEDMTISDPTICVKYETYEGFAFEILEENFIEKWWTRKLN